MSSSRKELFKKNMILGPMGPFDQKHKNIFVPNNSAPSSFKWRDKLITCKINQETPMSGSWKKTQKTGKQTERIS